MQSLFYFAYGSNLHPARLQERVPSAELVGTAALPAYRLYFHKRGQDASGKCNLLQTGQSTDVAHGAIYRIDPSHKAWLDEFEGAGYATHYISVEHRATTYRCFVYLAEADHIDDALLPYHWYRELVLRGACYLGFPASYRLQIETVSSTDDPDQLRKQKHAQLLDKIAKMRE